ncbi:MAG TPA: glycosyltransferase family 4 protein [Actinomycetota bacterium]|nr:glycosyltransferase family 4 protein [Actinomycetota bacterium]
MRSVLHVLGPSHGGIRRHVRHLAANPPPGWETAGVAGPADLAPYLEGLPFRPASALSVPGMRSVELVHAHGLTAGAWTGARPLRPPIVLTLHTDPTRVGRSSRSRALGAVAPLVVARAAAVIAASAEVAGAFTGAVHIPPAVDPRGAAVRPRAEVRAELGAGPDDVVVLTLARLSPEKDLDILLDAVREAGCLAWIAGDGPERRRLERLADGLPVRFLGHREDVADLLAAADVFALTSRSEAYPIVVVEAVTAGLPVVATRVGQVPDIAGDAGLLVAPGDRTAFAAALRTVTGDPSARVQLARAARAHALPTPAELVERVGAVYDEVVGR